MSWAIVGGVGGAAISAAGASKQAGAARDAASLAMSESRLARQSGHEAQNRLNSLMGFDATVQAKRKWKKDIKKNLYRDEFKNIKKTQGKEAANAFLDDKLKEKIAKYDDAENKGFLTQRFNNEQFEKDPGYQFRMDEGMREIGNSFAARGGALSGAALKALAKYNQNYASNEYGNAYNRFTNDQADMFNRLNLVGTQGQQATQWGVNQANQYNTSGAASRAAGMSGAWNSFSGGMGNFMNNLAPGGGAGGGAVQPTGGMNFNLSSMYRGL